MEIIKHWGNLTKACMVQRGGLLEEFCFEKLEQIKNVMCQNVYLATKAAFRGKCTA